MPCDGGVRVDLQHVGEKPRARGCRLPSRRCGATPATAARSPPRDRRRSSTGASCPRGARRRPVRPRRRREGRQGAEREQEDGEACDARGDHVRRCCWRGARRESVNTASRCGGSRRRPAAKRGRAAHSRAARWRHGPDDRRHARARARARGHRLRRAAASQIARRGRLARLHRGRQRVEGVTTQGLAATRTPMTPTSVAALPAGGSRRLGRRRSRLRGGADRRRDRRGGHRQRHGERRRRTGDARRARSRRCGDRPAVGWLRHRGGAAGSGHRRPRASADPPRAGRRLHRDDRWRRHVRLLGRRRPGHGRRARRRGRARRRAGRRAPLVVDAGAAFPERARALDRTGRSHHHRRRNRGLGLLGRRRPRDARGPPGPAGVAALGDGGLLIADTLDRRVRRVLRTARSRRSPATAEEGRVWTGSPRSPRSSTGPSPSRPPPTAGPGSLTARAFVASGSTASIRR